METPKKNILIVDDAPLIVRRLVEMLTDIPGLGWIKEAGDYAAAMESIRQHRPRILLLDINLPDKSGIDILRAVKEERPDTMIIMITNQGNEYYQKLCMKLGADYYIDKSIEFEQIAGIIAGIS